MMDRSSKKNYGVPHVRRVFGSLSRPLGLSVLFLAIMVSCGDKEALYPELWGAASGGKIEQVKQLVGKGLDINRKDMSGSTPIIHAATGGHTAIVAYLIDQGADVNVKEKSMGLSAISAAASGGHRDIVHLLLDAGATDTASAYMYAEQYHHMDIMNLLKDASQ